MGLFFSQEDKYTAPSQTDQTSVPEKPDKVIHVRNLQELQREKDDAIKNDKQLLVYEFTSKDYEPPCSTMSSKFNEFSKDPRFQRAAFLELDVDNFQDLARDFKLDVYPAFLLLSAKKDDDKQELCRVTGVNPQKLESSIEEALMANPPRGINRSITYMAY